MNTSIIFSIQHFDEVPSTNTLAQKLAAEGAREGTVVVAEHQTAGRGKPGRKWESPPGKNLLFSLILRPDIPVAEAPMLTQIACRSVATVLRENYGLTPEFKRPNDVLIAGKKICGVLTETSSSGKKLEAVIIGIGLNVNAAGAELFEGSTSIKEATGREADRKFSLEKLLDQIAADIQPLYSKREN